MNGRSDMIAAVRALQIELGQPVCFNIDDQGIGQQIVTLQKYLSTIIDVSQPSGFRFDPALVQSNIVDQALPGSIIKLQSTLDSVVTRAVGTKFGAIGGNNATMVQGDAGHASSTSRLAFRSPASTFSNPQWLFTNWRITPTGEVNGANAITVKAALEVGGVTYPLYFSGSRTAVLAPGDSLWCDKLNISFAASTQGFLRVWVSVVAGQTWGVSRACSVSNGEGSNYSSSVTPGIDAVDTTGVIPGSGTSGYVYSASACRGQVGSSAVPSVLVAGNSIAVGAGEIGAGTFGDANGFTGYIERGLGASTHWTTITRSSDTTANFIAGVKRFSMLSGMRFTSWISEYGTNDVYGAGLTFAQACAILLASWNVLAPYGRGFQCTILPRTTSTDAWVTTVNQTIVGAGTTNTVRTQVNDWLRDGAPILAGVPVATGTVGALRAGDVGHPLYKVWDIASIAETSLNSGIWKVTGGAWVFDGIHPSVLGNTNLQAGVVLADLL